MTPRRDGEGEGVTGLSRLRVYAMLVLVVLFWAGNSIAGRAVHEDVPPFTLALVRWTGALILLAPFAWRHLRRDWPMARRHWRAIVLLGVLGVAAVATWPLTGHPTASPVAGVSVVVDAIHLAAMAVWLGGLVMLAGFLLRQANERELGAILPIWSRWGADCSTTLTGLSTRPTSSGWSWTIPRSTAAPPRRSGCRGRPPNGAGRAPSRRAKDGARPGGPESARGWRPSARRRRGGSARS